MHCFAVIMNYPAQNTTVALSYMAIVRLLKPKVKGPGKDLP